MDYRIVTAAEEEAALALWDQVFGDGRGYFIRYFTVDPWYREGDCFAAWDGETMVSAVHVCRRPLAWEGQTLWCGAVSNVATLPEYRQRGISRELLRRSVELMERDRFDFSMLFTRRYGHYGALGWEKVPNPFLTLHLPRGGDNVIVTDIQEMVRKDWTALTDLWLKMPRPLSLQRTPHYTMGWCGWEWRKRGGRVFVLPEYGYMVLSESKRDSETLIAEEWAGDGVETELRLISHAAALARAVGRSKLLLTKQPVASTPALEEIGNVESGRSDTMMLRNVALEPGRYRALAEAYSTGAASWWPSDDF